MQNQTTAKKESGNLFWCQNHKGETYTYEESLRLIREFHGHTAPGLVIGTKMVAMAMQQIAEDVLFDVICETRSCLLDAVLSLKSVRIQPRHLVKQSKGKIVTCPQCGEAYPGKLGNTCGGCRGELPYEMVDTLNPIDVDRRPDLNAVATEEADGRFTAPQVRPSKCNFLSVQLGA